MSSPTSNFDPILAALSPRNKPYLLNLIQRVNTYDGPPAGELQLMAGDGDLRQCVVLLPGSFLDYRYMQDLAQGIGESRYYAVFGLNYPGRMPGAAEQEQPNQYTLADYVGAVYQALLKFQEDPRRQQLHLVGHSLGTIVLQILVLVAYYNQTHGLKDRVLQIKNIAVLGGGPPKLGLSDYLLTFSTRLHTLGVVAQMVNHPERFIAPSGGMQRTLGSAARYEEFRAKHMIYRESAPLMKETFVSGNYAFLPEKLLADMYIQALFVFSPQDLFVHARSSRKAVRQWGARPLAIPDGHSQMLFGEAGRSLGKQIFRFFKYHP